MAQTYTSGDITLKIDSLAKKEHVFVDENNKKQASITINRPNKDIKINLSTVRSSEDKTLFSDIVKCYNQFIDKNKKFNDYMLYIPNFNQDKLETYAVKADENSPIKLITKEQIDQLDKNNIPYYLFLNPNYGLRKIYGNNKRIFINNNDVINLDKPDSFKDCQFIFDVDKYGRTYRIYNNDDFSINLSLHLMNDADYDSDTYISVPSIEVLNKNEEDIGKLNITQIRNIRSVINGVQATKTPLDLSKIDTSKFSNIMLSYDFDKESLLKTLKTIKDIPYISFQAEAIKKLKIDVEPFALNRFEEKYNGKELLEILEKELNPSANLVNEL